MVGGVKLIVGLIARKEYLGSAEIHLEKKFSNIDFESQILEFNYTEYYNAEFGSPLSRKFLSFNKLVKPENLADIKLFTNKIEKKLSLFGKRRVNIDPGYLNQNKLVLATHKDFNHRIYLEKGIFAEVTLHFQEKSFRPWAWTYPDYRTQEYIDIFNKIRNIYIEQIVPKTK